MSEKILQLYALAKSGHFDKIAAAFATDFTQACTAVRFVKPSSGWTILHQAAYWNSRAGATSAIAFGADVSHRNNEGHTAGDVARSKGFNELAEWIDSASEDHLWTVPAKPIRPSSLREVKASAIADRDFDVGYAGGVVHVRKGNKYYVDAYGRVLVGWHGSFSPPRGMMHSRLWVISKIERPQISSSSSVIVNEMNSNHKSVRV
jgi:hypothetical protein